MRSLLVAPPFEKTLGNYYHFPIGLAYISSSIQEAGFSVKCLNLNHYFLAPTEALIENLREYDPDVLMVGGLSVHFNEIETILKIAKEVKPTITTIAGGGLISSEPISTLKALALDFGVIGEGEQTICELLAALENSSPVQIIPGLVLMKDGNSYCTEKRREIQDLNSIPWPDYEGFEIHKYLDHQHVGDMPYLSQFDEPREFPIISSRSCPFHCTFCYHPSGQKYRQRKLSLFFDEVDYLVKRYRVNILTVYDELFSNNKERIHEFCRRIAPYNLKWVVQLRVDHVDAEILKIMKKAGCFFISYGVESASSIILQSMRKQIHVRQIENALEQTRKEGIGTWGNLLFGDPAETMQTAEESIAWWEKHSVYQLWLMPVALYPGTQLYKIAEEKGFITDPINFKRHKEWCKYNLTQMKDEELHELYARILLLNEQNKLFAEKPDLFLISSNLIEGDIYEIHYSCPICHNKNHFPKVRIFLKDQSLLLPCRFCNQKVYIPAESYSAQILQLQAMVDRVINRVPSSRLAIWGHGSATIKLLTHTRLKTFPPFCILVPSVSGTSAVLGRIHLRQFHKDDVRLAREIDGVLIYSESAEPEDTVYHQLSFLQEFGVRLFYYQAFL